VIAVNTFLAAALCAYRIWPNLGRTFRCEWDHCWFARHTSTLNPSTDGAHFIPEIEFIMAYVITDSCIKDSLCVDVCPTDCIHPKQDEPGFEAATQMFVDPEGCIDCGACIPVCTSDSIHALDDLPEDKKDFIEKNTAFYAH
jgi:ferredoxin